MKIARIIDNQIDWIGEHTQIFGQSYVTEEDLTNSGFVIASFHQFNPLTEKSVSCDPFIENGGVFLDQIIALTEDEITLSKEIAMQRLRKNRNSLLFDCDYTQLMDYPHSDRLEWAAYRQALRDLPSTVTDARTSITWPIAPNA